MGFLAGGAADTPEDEYRTGVQFLEQDVRTGMPDGPFRLILCRNLVFTYFDEDLQRQTLRRIVDRLAPGGALMIGLTESLPEDGERLESWSRRFRVYRRVESEPAS